jgi:NAD(P)-dependent dehydrogenase (short-subunit alcohol dehydrogenase family)
MRVAIADLDHELARAAAQEIGRDTAGFSLDVRDRDHFMAFLDAAEDVLGSLDALVNNAGVLFLGPFAAEDPARMRQAVDVNLVGVMTGSQLALQRFLPRGRGHIVNVASSAGLAGVAGGATYSATKHGVVGLTRALRAEARGTGVRTTIVIPGVVRTEMIGGFSAVRGTRVLDPSAVGESIAKALRTGRPALIVPRELGPVARLVAGLPPRGSDLLKRLLRADDVMAKADTAARGDYERRARS